MSEQDSFADPLYRRTFRFVFSVAAELAVPARRCVGGHPVGDGYYYELEGEAISADEAAAIDAKVQELVAASEPITPVKKPWKEAMTYFTEKGLVCARSLLETRVSAQVDCYMCSGVLRLALFPLANSTASLKTKKLKVLHANPGLIATYVGDGYKAQPALRQAFAENVSFAKQCQVASVGSLNTLKAVGRSRKDYLLCCEFRQEGKLANIASMVQAREKEGKPVKVICIAGPTSSGKTTFATKLCMYLQNVGFVAEPLTVDHYYLPLDEQPKYKLRQQRADVDYDHIESMDVDLVGKHINALVQGEAVNTPIYNMKTGYRDGTEEFPAMPPNGVLVIEGIHALNPLYTQAVEASKVFKIFISPLTALQLDDHNAVKTTDHRLLRRMCRDNLFRGATASRTLGMWDNVRKGEGVWIFPHQNDADFVMNSAAEYEIPILKTFIEPLLRAVPADDAKFEKACEVLRLLDLFATWPPHLAPPAALLREFIGEGAFDCH